MVGFLGFVGGGGFWGAGLGGGCISLIKGMYCFFGNGLLVIFLEGGCYVGKGFCIWNFVIFLLLVLVFLLLFRGILFFFGGNWLLFVMFCRLLLKLEFVGMFLEVEVVIILVFIGLVLFILVVLKLILFIFFYKLLGI